jgi:hypothetical protein
MIVGLLQYPYMLTFQDSLGSATTFSVIVSYAVTTIAPKKANTHFWGFINKGYKALIQVTQYSQFILNFSAKLYCWCYFRSFYFFPIIRQFLFW